MLKFSRNKRQTFECKVEIEGADYKQTKPRLIFSPNGDTKSILIEGKIEGGNCKVVIPEGLDIARTGNVVLEILVDNTRFIPWTSQYEMLIESIKINEIIIKKNEGAVKIVEAKMNEQKPKISVSIKEKVKPHFLKESISPKSRKLVEAFIYFYQKMPKKDKRFLKEHISKTYIPSKKAKAWAVSIFKETKTLIPKIVMYAFDGGKK